MSELGHEHACEVPKRHRSFTPNTGRTCRPSAPRIRANVCREHMQQRACAEADLLDHLIGTCEERRRERQAERLRSLEVNDQLKPGRLLNRQISRLLAP
jgi:hypothetical protein